MSLDGYHDAPMPISDAERQKRKEAEANREKSTAEKFDAINKKIKMLALNAEEQDGNFEPAKEESKRILELIEELEAKYNSLK